MISTISEVLKVDRSDGQLPYFVIKANAVQGDAEAEALDEDGFINPLACMSRSFKLTKCAFPATEAQAAGLEATLIEGAKVRLGLFQVPMGKKFYIQNAEGSLISDTVKNTVTRVNNTGKNITVNGKVVLPGKGYEEEEITETPRIYENVSLVLFVDKNENSLEGKPEEIAKRNFDSGIAKGSYQLVD